MAIPGREGSSGLDFEPWTLSGDWDCYFGRPSVPQVYPRCHCDQFILYHQRHHLGRTAPSGS